MMLLYNYKLQQVVVPLGASKEVLQC